MKLEVCMLSYYVVYFTIMSFVGYIYECFAMTLWTGKWENRGFLYGPIIPIYGVGSVIGLIVFGQVFTEYTPTFVFCVGFFGSALLEYPTSWTLEKLFHAYWWDYSSAPLNINGRISFFSSLGFGLAAIIIVYIINPHLWPFILNVNNRLIEIISYIIVVIISVDATLTISVLSSFEDKVSIANNYINEYLSNTVENINPSGKNLKEAIKYTKENVIDTGAEKVVDTMNFLYHGAISRIKGFRNSSNEGISVLKSKIKNRINNIRKKNER